VSVSRHFLLQAPQCPWSVRKRFSRDHCWRGRSKPGLTNTKENPGEMAEKNEEPDNKNPHFLNNHLILDLVMPLVNHWSPLTHISHCTTTSWTSSHTDESKSKPCHATQDIFTPDAIPAATLPISVLENLELHHHSKKNGTVYTHEVRGKTALTRLRPTER